MVNAAQGMAIANAAYLMRVGAGVGRPAIALARHRHIGSLAEDAALGEKSHQREDQQHDRKRGGAAEIGLGADDCEKDLGRQHDPSSRRAGSDCRNPPDSR